MWLKELFSKREKTIFRKVFEDQEHFKKMLQDSKEEIKHWWVDESKRSEV